MIALKDVCISISDGDHNAPPKTTDANSVPFVTISDMQPEYGTFDFNGANRVPIDYYDNLANIRKPKSGDIVYSVVGSFGIPILVKNDDPFVFQRHIAILRPNNNLILSEYLYYLMSSRAFYSWADSAAIGAAQRTITLGALRNKLITLPSLEDQANIVAKLQAFDSLIENNRKQIKLLEEAAQRLYKEWFIDLRYPGHESAIINQENGLPEEWTYRMFLDVVDYVRGRSYTAQDLNDSAKRNLVNLSNIAPFGGWQTGGEKPYSGVYKEEQIVQGGNLIMAVTDMTKERRLVGHVGVIPRELSGSIISMDLIKLDSMELDTGFLYGQLRYSGIASMISMLANGTNVLHLKPESLNRVRLLSPKQELQEWYGNVIKPILSTIDCLNEKNTHLAEARNRLIPILLPGKEGLGWQE